MLCSAGTSWGSPPLAPGVPVLRGRGGGRSQQEDDAYAAAVSLDPIDLSVLAVRRYKCSQAGASLRSPHLHGVTTVATCTTARSTRVGVVRLVVAIAANSNGVDRALVRQRVGDVRP